jgi:3-deoxy-manno-octulosonate cytidylyltransferase (CMP-KDO synthetase)
MTGHRLPTNPIVVIPARMASTRLPGKPLADIHGEAMIVHVWRRGIEAGLGPVIVACAEAEIAKAVEAAGGRAVLTDPAHPSGSDRIFEALGKIDPEGRHDAVINLQGDLPTIDPKIIRRCLDPLADPAVDIATLVAGIVEPREIHEPSVVKAALALDPKTRLGRALYFSRAAIPSGEGPRYHHIGLYAYRPAALRRFVALAPGILETREKLEQLRALEAGMRIDAACVDTVPFGVDTPQDLERARSMLAPANRTP